jgi:hypothetical protein
MLEEEIKMPVYLIQKFIQPSSKPYDTSFKNVGHFHHLCKGGSLYEDNNTYN